MKEATGELNATVIVVISIGVLSTFFFTVLWPILKGNMEANSNCSKATCDCRESKRVKHDGIEYCKCKSKSGSSEFECVYKG